MISAVAPRMRLLGVYVSLMLVLAASQPAAAGPARYDPKARAFILTYTYAYLPHFGMQPQQVEQLGQLQEATKEQDAQVRALLQPVSEVLHEITGGRARIGSLEYVNNIKKADIVVSLEGNFNRAGWAISGAIEGRPGQVGLYYKYLASPERSHQDVVLTVAHELGHYLFSLPDEYSNSDPNAASCPMRNPGGPGCLMDNYMMRHGYVGLCTKGGTVEHNPNGPRQNPGTIVQGHSAEDDCKSLVDRFFDTHPPGPVSEGEDPGSGAGMGAELLAGGASAMSGAVDPVDTAENPFRGQFRRLVESAVSFTLDEFETAQEKANRPGVAASSNNEVRSLRAIAQKFLTEQLQKTPGAAEAMSDPRDLAKAVDLISRRVADRRIERPSSLTTDEIAKLRTKAADLVKERTGRRGRSDLLQLLMGTPPRSDAETRREVDAIKQLLIRFLLTSVRRAAIGFSPRTSAPTTEEQRFIEQIARAAVTGQSETGSFARYEEAAKLHIQMSYDLNATLNQLANELDLPGPEFRRERLTALQAQLDKLRLPGKPYTGFGFRRTYILAPPPLHPAGDFLDLDSGDRIPYHGVRNLAITEFIRVAQRERIEFLGSGPEAGAAASSRLRVSTGFLNLGDDFTGKTSGERFAIQVGQVNALIDLVRRNLAENIIILAPPGGLSQETGDALEELRRIIQYHADVRIDLILLGDDQVPLRLRDLIHQSGGTVQNAVDVDEVGLIAQRLKNDVAAGSWAAAPQQGYVDFSPATEEDGADDGRDRQRGEGLTIERLKSRYLSHQSLLSPELRDAIQQGHRNARDLRQEVDDARTEARRKANHGLDPIFELSKRELDEFLAQEANYAHHFVRDESRPITYEADVKGTVTRLYEVRRLFDVLDEQLSRLGDESGVPASRQFIELRKTVIQAKQLLRKSLGVSDVFESPLTDTDDYLDWILRRILIAQADRMARADWTVDVGSFRRRQLRKSAYLLRRASERDQILADCEETLYAWENEREDIFRALSDAISGQYGTALPLSPELILSDSRSRELRRQIEELESTEAAGTPDSPQLLLRAVRYIIESLEADLGPDPRAKRLSEAERRHYLLRAIGYLSRRSLRGADPEEFHKQVNLLRHFLDDNPRDSDPGEIVAKRLETLEHREIVMESSAANVRDDVALTPSLAQSRRIALDTLLDGLKNNGELAQALFPPPEDDDRFITIYEVGNLKKTTKPVAEYLRLEELAQHEDLDLRARAVKMRVEELVRSRFPLLMLNLLGRLRMFEDDLKLAEEQIDEHADVRPFHERLGQLRKRTEFNARATRDGRSIEITFEPFQAERNADYEMIIGLSRPLRDFEAMKSDVEPPALRLYQDDRLVERTYLVFDADASTDTLLVFRIPRPNLKVGMLGEGLYTPKLLIQRRYMPIVGRDNTINYTFSVGTQRPNVQLIASLRQPQAKDGEIDPVKDPEFAFRGTIPSNLNEAIVEVQVLAGSSVRHADVSGFFQRFDKSGRAIDTPNLNFVDDGIFPDMVKDDGVYTARIALLPPSRKQPAEYRVFIEAKSTDEVAFIPLAEPIPVREGAEKPDVDKTPPPVPAFQRATSLNFRVAGEN